MTITNRKPVFRDAPEQDPLEIAAIKERAYLRRLEGRSDYQCHEVDRDEDFVSEKSSASCCIDDIQAIIFGGLSARFWMLRKHINSMSIEKLSRLPFYSW